MNLAGGLFRVISTWGFVSITGRYPIVFIGNSMIFFSIYNIYSNLGQFICAFAQTFTLFIPTKFAFIWFPEHQRTLANSLCFAGIKKKFKENLFLKFFSLSKFFGSFYWNSFTTDYCPTSG